MNKQEKALKNFGKMNCNQSVFAAFGPDYGVSEELCFKLGLSFGGGMAKQGKTCGAVTGAYNAIGLWSATHTDDKGRQKQIAVEKVQEFNKLFIKQYGHTDCKALLKYDISIAEEAQKIEELGLTKSVCPDLIGYSAKILEEILN